MKLLFIFSFVLLSTIAIAMPTGDSYTGVDQQQREHKANVNEEIEQKFGSYKDECFPKPSGGCTCNEKDAEGNDVVAKYITDEECKVSDFHDEEVDDMDKRRRRRDAATTPDPIRQKAQNQYSLVVQELNEKFKGLRDGCYPRVKGCLCVVGKDGSGRDITERRMKDVDCKCRQGEVGPGCPAAAAG